MTDNDREGFRTAMEFFDKWRSVTIETDEQWAEFARDVGEACGRMDKNLLGQKLMEAVLDTFNAMYKDGMKPVEENYFGRDDL